MVLRFRKPWKKPAKLNSNVSSDREDPILRRYMAFLLDHS